MEPSSTMVLQSILTRDEEELQLTLPKEQWLNSHLLYFYQGFWSPSLEATIALQKHFQAQHTDIFISSCRKAGTTWLKSLVFSLCNRTKYQPSNSPLLSHNPHDLIPQLESNIYGKSRCPDLTNFVSPRLFGTHLPFPSLPDSIKESNCKIIYICRNPLDLFVSSWLFYLKFEGNEGINKDTIGHYLDKFCEGKFPFGPYEDHVLGYWKQSMKQPKKVMFVKYEDLKADPKQQLKQLAEFVGCPFSVEEEIEGVLDGILDLCSIQKLKQVDANKNALSFNPRVHNSWLFRQGEVGDWVNYLTPAMALKLEKHMEEKFIGSGMTFN